MRERIDLTGKGAAQVHPAVAAAQRNPTEAAPQGTPDKKPLTPREVTLRVTYPDPESGDDRVVELTSRVMTADERKLCGVIAADRRNGRPAALFDQTALDEQECYARAIVQLRDVPAPVLDAVLDNPVTLLRLGGVLLAHERRYFLGDQGAGGAASDGPSVVALWPGTNGG